jgi:uncharacterized protein YjbI with pentapeptide repeats
MAVIGAAVSAVTTYVAQIDHAWKERLNALDAAISALGRDTSEVARVHTLDSLGTTGVAEHLKPRAIQGLQNFIRDRTHLQMACARIAAKLPERNIARDVDRAFLLIAQLQSKRSFHRVSPDRMTDNFLASWHDVQLTVGPFALDGADLRGATMNGVTMRSATLIDACLTGAHLRGAILDEAHFNGAILEDADFQDSAFLYHADFTHARMRSSLLDSASADRAIFDHADLSDAHLSGAKLRNAHLFAADLSCATLGNAHLEGADVRDVTASWAFFGGAYLAGVRGWSKVADFTGAYLNEAHDLPDTSRSLAHKRGAVPDTTNLIRWTLARTQQLERGGLCAANRTSPASQKGGNRRGGFHRANTGRRT